MKCQRCHRELKNHTESGLGKICRMKANRLSEPALENKIRVEPMFIYNRRQARRAYLVFTSPRVKVVVNETVDGKFASCDCSAGRCEHIALVANIDNLRFPQAVGV